jgi:uncharacterized protein
MGPITYLKEDGHEIDFIIDDHTAIEVKATHRIQAEDLKGIRYFQEKKKFKRCCVISLDETRRLIDGHIEVWPWNEFLLDLYSSQS